VNRVLSKKLLKPGALLLAAAASGAVVVSASASTTAAAPAVPKLVTAHRITSSAKGVLKRGRVVSSASLGVRVFPNATHGFALATVSGVSYPAATVDGGKTWKVDGPPLHLPAAQAPLVVTQVGAHKSTYFAWGGPQGGNVVDVSADAGKHWWQAFLGGVLLSVVSAPNGHLIASAQSPTGTTGLQTQNSVYVSNDGGHHWRLNTRFGSF
jgi:hypothetical protein